MGSGFPFRTEDVLALLGYACAGNRSSVYIRCPFCHSKNKPLNFDLATSKYRCNKNPDHHGNILTFYRDLEGCDDSKEAYREICERLRIDAHAYTPKTPDQDPEKNVDLPYDIVRTDQAYRKILAKSYLSSKNRKELNRRGFTDENLDSLSYKTLPERDGLEIFQFVKELSIENPSGIPGFYRSKKGAWMFAHGKRGVIVPYRDFYGRIQGAQVRKDDDVRKMVDGQLENKYSFISARYKRDGGAAVQFAHYTGEFRTQEDGSKKLYVPSGTLVMTEGGMKIDLFRCLTKQPGMGLPGVNCETVLERELPIIKENGIHTIYMGFDMDRMMNINVAAALPKIEAAIKRHGLNCKYLQWDTEYLTIKKEQKRLQTETMFVFTPETIDKNLEDGILDQTLQRAFDLNKRRIMFALKSEECATEENAKRYKALKKACDRFGFIECTPIYWNLKHKGIDDYYAYKLKGIE